MKTEDREFLAALGDVVFGNPFTPQRVAIIRRLAPNAPGDLSSDREALARVVAPRLRSLTAARVAADEQPLLEPALAYVAYHRYVPQLDAHIERQADQTGAPLPVPFGDDAVRDLVQSGFTEQRAYAAASRPRVLERALESTHRSIATDERARSGLALARSA